MGQYFLRQNAGRHRSGVPAGFHPLDDDRIDTGAHELLGDRQRWREGGDLGARITYLGHGLTRG